MSGWIRKMRREHGASAVFGKHIAVGLAAAGFLLSPVHARASEITKPTGQTGAMTQNGGVYNIFADQQTNKAAFNVFDKFSLDSGNIANLFFRTSADGTDANALVNILKSGKFDINGTVNAIQDYQNKHVGGSLYFVSAEGITVGATGVVNAGAINLVTPTQTGVNSMFDSGNTVKDTFDPTTLLTGGMTINPSGTISVAGKLNAVDGVVMSAGKIEVVKTDPKTPSDPGAFAAIRTEDNLDFSSLVNIDGVASGMNGGTLAATPGMGGDIVLAAVATSTGKAASDQVLAAAGYKERDAKISVEQGTSISSRGGVTLSATAVNKDKSFSDIRDLNLRELNSWIPEGSNPLGEVVFLSATADVDGAITGTNVDISATTFNQYASTNDADSWSNISAQGRAASQFAQNSFGWIEKMQNTFRVTPIYSYRDSEAKVNIGEHAVLMATQAPNIVKPGSEDVLPSGISAKASATTVNVTIAATSIDSSYVNPNQHAPQPGEEEPDVTPVHRLTGATVVYAADANDVAVNIADGAKLDAQGDITVDASASDMMIGMGIVASMDPTAGQTYIDTAVVIGDAKNQAAVSVGQGASLTSSEGAVNLSAGASNSTDLGAIVAASSDSVSATAVTIYNQDSAAKVSVEGALSGKNGVSVSASDTTTRNNISANNAMMGFPPPPGAQRGANANIEQDAAQAFLQGNENAPGPVVQAVEQSALRKAKEKAEKALSLLGKYATVGASVAVANETHTAEIALGNTAALTAENGAVSLDAKTQMNQGTNMTAMGTLMNLNPANASTAEIDAAVLVANIENDAKITVADGTVDQHAVLSGTSVSVNAESEHDWGRIDGIIADYERIFNAIKTAMEDIQKTYDTLTDDEKDLVAKIADFEKTAQDIRQAATLSVGLDLNNYVGNGVTSMPTSVMGLFEDIVSMGAAMQRIDAARGNHYQYEIQTINQSINDFCTKFLKPENYGNFVAAATVNAVGSNNNAQFNHQDNQETKLSVAGTINVNNLANRANVHIGDYTELVAAAGAADVKAGTSQHSVAMNGIVNVNVNVTPLLEWVENKLHLQTMQDSFPDIGQLIQVSDNTSGPNAFGGTVGVAVRDTESTVDVGKNASITGYASTTGSVGNGVTMQGNNDTIVTDITFGAGEAASVGVQGMVGILTGDAKSGVTVGEGSKIVAKSSDVGGRYSGIDVTGNMNNTVTNLVGAISRSNGSAAGVSVGITKFGADNTVAVSGALDAAAVNMDALTDGAVNTISVAGSISTQSREANGQQQEGDAVNPGDVVEDDAGLQNAEAQAEQQAEQGAANVQQNMHDAIEHTENEEQGGNNAAALARQETAEIPSLNLSAAGSVSVNVVDVNTAAKLDKAAVTLHQDQDGDAAKLTAKAEDASFIGAWSGAAAVTWQQQRDANGNAVLNEVAEGGANQDAANDGNPNPAGQNAAQRAQNQQNAEGNLEKGPASVGLAGAAAVNVTDQTVLSAIDHTTMTNAARVQNFAEKDGANVAAALALAVTNNESDSTTFSGAASVSYNQLANDVRARMDGSSVTGGTDTRLVNVAYDSDTQVTGGVSLDVMKGGSTSIGAGGTVVLARLDNTLAAEIKGGGIYTGIGSLTDHAAIDITQVGAAAAVGVSSGATSSYSFQGAAAVNLLDNDVSAAIGDGTARTTVEAKSIDLAAYDTNGENLGKNFDRYISSMGIDAMGDSYKDIAKGNAATDNGGDDSVKTYDVDATSGGTVIVTGGVTLSAATGAESGVGLAGAASATTMDNDITARVENADIRATGDGIDVRANADALLIDVAAGATASGASVSGAGSVSVQITANDVLAEAKDSKLTADDVNLEASTESKEINVAGQIGIGKSGGGLALALNKLENSTEARLTKTDVAALETEIGSSGYKEALTGSAVNVSAKNTGKVYAVGAGVGGGENAGLTGALALNFGKDSLAAVIEGYEGGTTALKNLRALSVDADNDSYRLAVAGGVQGAGKAAVGGAVAYNELGAWSSDAADPDGKQTHTASVKNVNVTTMDWDWLEKLGYTEDAADDDKKITKTDATIDINASDTSKLVTVGAGVGVSSGAAAVEGAAAVSRLGRVTAAEMEHMDVDADDVSGDELVNRQHLNTTLSLGLDEETMKKRTAGSTLSAGASSGGSVDNVGVVVTMASHAAVGAGVAVTQTGADVKATMKDSRQTVGGGFSLTADTKDTIVDAAAGVNAGNAAVSGSVAVNRLTGETKAEITGVSELKTDGNAVVAAQSDASIDNFAGTLSVGGVGAAVGLSVSVNDIDTDTRALVSGGKASIAAGMSPASAASLANWVDDDQILDRFVDTTDTNKPSETLERSSKDYYGAVVSASSTEKINSWLGNLGGAGKGGAVDGAVNVNTISGETKAEADAASISGKEVSVIAHDYANNAAFTGSITASGVGASVGIGVNVTKTDRNTTAALTNSRSGVKADISAEGVAVEAVQKHGLAGMDLGVTGALEGATVGNVDDIATLSGKTAAALKNANLRLSGGDLAVTAEHETNLHTFGLTAAFVGEGGAVGVGVNVVKDGSEADASFQDSTATFAETGKTAVNVSAKNDVEDSYQLYTLSGDGIGGSAAVTVSVGNTESKTNAAMDGVTLGDADSRAKSVSVTAENKMTVKQQEWTGSVGGCGGSAGVGVNVATVDSTVGATMENSAAYSASDVTVDAKDVRDVTSLNGSTLAGIGEIGANVSVLTVGQEVDETSYSTSYQWKDEDGNTKTTTINAKEDAGANIEAAYSEAASVISDGKDASANTFGWSGGASETVLGKGGTGSAVAAKVNGSTVASGGNIKVASAEQTDVEAKQYATGGGVAIITGSVAVADTTRNAKTDILSSTLSAGGNIELSADVSGTTDLKTVQGDGGAITINGAFSFSEASGENRLSVSASTLDADHMVHIAAKDSSETSLSATTGSGAVGAVVGVQVAHGSMAGDTSVAMSGTTVSASGTTVGYTSMDGSGNIEAWNQNITIAAENAPTLSTKLQSGEGAAGVSVTVAVSKIQAGDEDDALNTSVSIDGSTKLLSTHAEDGQDEEKTNDAKAKDAISISAKANIKQDADMDAVDAAGGAAVGVNYGGAAVNSHVSVALGDGAAYTAEKLSVSGETALSQDIDAHGVDGAAGVGVANNAVKADNTLRTTVELGGASSSSRLAAADIAAKSGVNTTLSAQSYGGSILNVAAAEADNMLENITKANVSGKWSTTGGDFSVSATNDETLGVTVDTTDAAILDASGGSVDSESSHTAEVNLKNAVITTAGQQKYAANNNFNDKIELDASGYGGVAVGASDLRQDHSYAANVNLESATLDADGSVIASASSTGSIGTVNNVEAAGVVDATAANSKFKTTYGNTVKATDATVKTKYDVDSGDDADILFAAWDDTELSYETYGDSQGGVMGVANAIGENTLVRANTVEIGGASALESEGGLKLYASRDTSGNDADLDFKLITESINHNIVPLELKASMDSTMTQTNTVAISNGAKAESVGDAKLAADTGYAKLTMYTDAYNLWASNEDNGTSDGPGIVTTQDGTLKDYESEANGVKIDGTVTAGVHAEAEAAISGEVTVTQATDAQGNPTGSPTYDTSGITVSVTKGGDWLKAEDFTIGTVTRENPYYERYEELRKLMGEYAGMPQYDDYKAELESLYETMEKAGYAHKGETSYLVFQTVTAPAVETPNLSVSGGNIYVDAGSLTVNGTLHAKGDPSIKLTNSALIDLDVNDAVIQKNGGNVYFNNTGVSAGSEISGLSGAEHIQADGSNDSVTPSIVIESNAAKDSAKKLRADINVNGSVVNEAGSVAIENKHFDIHIGADANVVGETVRLAAENGSVYQVNPKGTVLVGSNPIQQWMVSDEVFEKIVEALHKNIADRGDGTTQVKNSFANYTKWRDYLISCGVSADDIPASQPGADDSKGILAGESVYILANSVNLGGLVQAGYGSYTATLGADAQTAVESLDSKWNGTSLTDAEVMSDSAYLVNEDAAGAKYDSGKKEWVYTPGIYYNPSTKKLLVENVSASGGNIYIEGRVSNTGGGRLRAADGASNVTVDTSAVSRDVVAYGADSTGGEGFIQIKDKLQGDDAHDAKVFEYRNGKNRSYLEGEEPGAWQSGSANFAPKDNLTYTWTAGYGETTVVSKSYTEKEYLWGLIEYNSADEIESEHSEDIKTEGTKTYDKGALDSGSYLKVREDGPESLFQIQIDYTQDKTAKSDVTEHTEETWGWGDCYKRVKYTWDETTRTGSTTTFSVSGANPVTIGFLDGGDGHIAINTGSGNTLELAGSLSAAEKGEVKITTKELEKGSGTIVANSVAIDAQTGIDAKHAALSAEDTANINISTAAGAIDFDSTKGHLKVRNASSGGDIADGALSRVSIAAEGDIKSDATSGTAAVTANRVELASRTGAIGSEIKPFAIQAGQENSAYHSVSAAAEKDIFLAQTTGDMRIDKIESASGDVALSAAGDFVDAARHEEDAVVSGTRLDRWYTQAFLSSEDAEDSRAKSGENAKEARMNGLNKRAAYLGARSETKNAEDYKNEAAAFAADETMQAAQRTYLRALQAASALDGDEKTAAQEAAYDALLSARESYFEGKGYSGDEKNLIVHYAAVDVDVDNYGWSKNDVLYAVAANVMNSEPGETELRDTANIAVHGDRNISLAAGGGIGMDGEAVAISAADLDKTENRRILANARAGEVTVNRDENGAITDITVQQQIPVTISTETGGVSATSEAQVYLATTKGETLRINGSINATGSDVRLEAGNGVVMATDGVIFGKDLLIYGGAGDVGTEDAPIVTDISGTLAANSAKSVVIDQPYTNPNHNTLTVKSVAAGENILLHSANGIEMENGGMGYLNAGDTITLNAAGDIGKETAMRVLANGAAVNAEAKDGGAIRIEGIGDGNLFLGTLQAEDGTVETINKTGNIVLSRAEDTESGRDAVSADITAGDISLDAVTLNLTGGSLEATNANGTLSLTAANTIEQKNTETSKLAAAGEVVLTAGTTGDADEEKNAGGSISLQSTDNTFGVVNIYAADEEKGIEGEIAVVSTASDGLTANFGAGEDGTGTLAVTGGTVNVKNAQAGGDLTIGGKLTTDEDISFAGEGDLALAAGTELTAETGDVTLSGDGISVGEGAKVTADNDVSATATNVLTNAGTITAGNNAAVTSKNGDLTLANVTAENDATITAEKGNVSVASSVTAGNTLDVEAGENALIVGDVEAKNIIANAGNGSVTVQGDVETVGDISLTAKENVTFTGKNEAANISISAGKNATLSGDSTAARDFTVEAGGNFIVTAGADIAAGEDFTATAAEFGADFGTITAGENVNIESTGADLALRDITATNGNVTATAKNGSVSVADSVTAGDTLEVTAKEDIAIDGAVAAQNVDATAESGSITVSGNMATGGNIALRAKENITAENLSTETGGSVKAVSIEGNVTIADVSAKDNIEITAAKGNATLANASSTAGGLSVSAGENAIVDGKSAAANIIIAAGKNATLRGDGTASEDVRLSAGNNVIAMDVAAGSDIAATAGNNATLASANSTGGSIALTVGGDAKLAGDSAAAHDFTVETGRNFIVTNNADIAAGRDFTATAADYGFSAGTVTAGQNVSIEATGADLALHNVTATNGTVTAIAAGDIVLGGHEGAVTAGKDVVAIARDGSVTVRENVEAGGTVEADGATDVTLYGTVTARDVIANAENGSVTVSGDMTTGGLISLSAKGDVKADSLSATEGGGSIAVRSETGNILLADASSRGDISVTAAKGNAVLASASSTAGNISLSAAGDAELAGNSSAAQDFNIQAGGDFVVNYGTALTAGGDFNAVAHDYGFNAGSITAENNVSIESTSASLILHNVTAKSGDVTAIAANDVVLGGHAGTVEAGGDVIAVAKGGSVDVTEHIAAGETIDVTAAENVNIKSTVLESAKSISAVAQNGDVATDGAINARGSISLAAGNRVIFDGDATAGEDISVVAGKSIEFPDAISAGRDASLKIQNGDMAAKTVVAGRDVSLQTGGRTGLEHWVEAFYPQSGSGDIYAESVTAGRDAIITAANGNITLGTVEGKNAVSIFDYAPTSFMRAGTVKTDGLFTLFAWQREIGQMEVDGYFDIVLMASGDNLRKATGWDSALEAEHRMDWEYYRFHHDLLGLSRLIDIYDYWNTMPRNAEEDELLVEET